MAKKKDETGTMRKHMLEKKDMRQVMRPIAKRRNTKIILIK